MSSEEYSDGVLWGGVCGRDEISLWTKDCFLEEGALIVTVEGQGGVTHVESAG